nr:EOG090X01OH [Cyclestheria hislopi]
MSILKRKLDQVAQFGCTAFALLFDDIEPEMSESDKEAFQSFAQAQVSITNEIYQHLNHPKGFLFCPTQYCASRAVPDVRNSEYLNTIGSKLAPDIDIMWTGPKVISRIISPASVDEINEVLRRKIVIWDNLHANDYDQKRVFLGPYSGRSPALLSKLKGVLTNPNCEYGANFVAIHTLAQWSKCSSDNISEVNGNEAVSADIKLEQENRSGNCNEDDIEIPDHIYHPRLALKRSLQLWLHEFKKAKSMWGPISKPHVSSVPPPSLPFSSTSNSVPLGSSSSSTSSFDATITSTATPIAIEAVSEDAGNEPVHETAIAPCNADGTESAGSASMASLERICECNLEPMETVETNSSSSSHDKKLDVEDVEDEKLDDKVEEDVKEELPMQDVVMKEGERKDDEEEYQLTMEDLYLLSDLFYLPFEHGPQGMQLLQEFSWLKAHAHLVAGLRSKQDNAANFSPEVQEWHDRANKFDSMSRALNRLFTRLTYISNRELLYELYPYVWDMRGVVALLNSYVKWLAFNQGCKQAFLTGEQEPWVFRGGLAADLQRLLPLESANDLFLYKSPDTPTRQVYTIRPYLPSDERTVYNLCHKLYLSRFGNGNEQLNVALHSYPDLVGDVYVGPFVTLSPELGFVVEDDSSVVGFVVAAANAGEILKRIRVAWLPEMEAKYPNLMLTSSQTEDRMPACLKELAMTFHRLTIDLPETLLSYHPSQLKMGLLDSVIDNSVPKRLMTCIVAALRAHGSSGCYVEVTPIDALSMDFYSRLGFMEVKNIKHSQEVGYFGRIF